MSYSAAESAPPPSITNGITTTPANGRPRDDPAAAEPDGKPRSAVESDSGSGEEEDSEEEGSDEEDEEEREVGEEGEDSGDEEEQSPQPADPPPGPALAAAGAAAPLVSGDGGRTEDSEDESEGEDEDEDEEEEDDDEPFEPPFKYERVTGDVATSLIKDTASCLVATSEFMALGTHAGFLHVFSHDGQRSKVFRPHTATIYDISLDAASEFIASASVDGQVFISSLTTPERYAFDFRRPMRAIALDPLFGRRSTRAFVCGGMAGRLVLHEKGWLGHKEVELQPEGREGPMWAVRWRGNFIAWANDAGVRIYDTSAAMRLAFIERTPGAPRADLFKATLFWQDDNTLLISWADIIRIVHIRPRRPYSDPVPTPSSHPTLIAEIKSTFQTDCMISSIAPFTSDLLVLAWIAPDGLAASADQAPPADRDAQRRRAANRPELRIISREGEESADDALSLTDYHLYGCNDYALVPSAEGTQGDPFFLVMSPRDVVRVRPRDEVDHVNWLLENERYEEALRAAEQLGPDRGFDLNDIGRRYLEWLVGRGNYEKAASTAPSILGQNVKAWEDFVFLYAQERQLQIIIPFIPTHEPQLGRLVYGMVLAHLLRSDREALLRTIREWPSDIYDISVVIVAVQGELERSPSSTVLMDCLADLYVANRQPGKALPYYLRLRRAGVFDLIKNHSLWTDVQDQARQLVEFDESMSKKDEDKDAAASEQESPALPLLSGEEKPSRERHGAAINLLVDHTHSIQINRVVSQLELEPRYLYMYLDALFQKDPHLASDYGDMQVELYAEFDYPRLMDFLRASQFYSLEKAYQECKERDLVPEMVFLLGRMGSNKQALSLIIERLGDVQRAIEFAKEQNDDDLWEDLLKYSETRPLFIRGLLENVGAEIDPIRLIRRIKDGLEIPGLKEALIKILQDFNLQISLLEGCRSILYSDVKALSNELHRGQTRGFLGTPATKCTLTSLPVFPMTAPTAVPTAPSVSHPPALVFLSGQAVRATAVLPPGVDLPPSSTSTYAFERSRAGAGAIAADVGSKISWTALMRARMGDRREWDWGGSGGASVAVDAGLARSGKSQWREGLVWIS